ncbi:DUF1796 family putative cysteine peptidase [Paenibacillus lactis]|uniref:Peptidase n=1 Tax=Paenibacillus lactis 154 TaxID=743719 RepID=G4HA42_9BACL|nr:DUF1796 family putative cysteine peptidase [Paenibacillus lactis]EHB66801.1 Protein of unknown function DUF1796 putative papain-like cysteine peptidase [Paenibacillus lactis 154]
MVTNVKLGDLKGAYDVIISLGSWCGPSIYLQRKQLRRFSFPLDWMVSSAVTDVTHLIKSRFEGFMELGQLRKIEGTSAYLEEGITVPEGGTHLSAHFILDSRYNIISVHDFPIVPNQDWVAAYNAYQEKLARRIQRFWYVLQHSRSVLFVRWGEIGVQEAVALHAVLSSLTPASCSILFMQPVSGLESIQEIDWELGGISTLQVPLERPNDIAVWDYALNGLSLTGYWT